MAVRARPHHAAAQPTRGAPRPPPAGAAAPAPWQVPTRLQAWMAAMAAMAAARAARGAPASESAPAMAAAAVGAAGTEYDVRRWGTAEVQAWGSRAGLEADTLQAMAAQEVPARQSAPHSGRARRGFSMNHLRVYTSTLVHKCTSDSAENSVLVRVHSAGRWCKLSC